MQNKDFAVVVPVFNSENTLEELFSRIQAVFTRLNKTFRVVFVEDYGIDHSWDVITKIKALNPDEVVAIKLAKNFGQHNAILCGLKHCHADLIITIDDDLQIPPEEITKLIDCFTKTDADLVYGHLIAKKHNFIRNLGSSIIKGISKKLNNAPGEGSSFKLISSELVDKILTHNQHFVYIDELLLWYTDNIEFADVEHRKRTGGKSGYNAFKLFNLATNLVIYYTAIPLRLMVMGGIAGSIFTLIFALYRIYRKMYHRVPMGYTSIIVTILFSTSIILLSLGIIGEYLNRMYKIQNKKPPYSIKKILK